MQRIRYGRGFIAALDQSGASTPRALEAYGIGRAEWTSEQEMFALIHRMRSRVVSSTSFNDARILATILFEGTLEKPVEGRSITEFLDQKGIVTFLKIDEGLDEERCGVRLMKPLTSLRSRLERARVHGVHGTKARSLILQPNLDGIAALVEQQFSLATLVAAAEFMPIIEPEVALDSQDREAAEVMLHSALRSALEQWHDAVPVVLKLSPPVVADTYADLLDLPAVARIAALSGGLDRTSACRELARNKGMIASFSRALLQDLKVGMTEREFDKALGCAIAEIYAASVTKTALAKNSG